MSRYGKNERRKKQFTDWVLGALPEQFTVDKLRTIYMECFGDQLDPATPLIEWAKAMGYIEQRGTSKRPTFHRTARVSVRTPSGRRYWYPNKLFGKQPPTPPAI